MVSVAYYGMHLEFASGTASFDNLDFLLCRWLCVLGQVFMNRSRLLWPRCYFRGGCGFRRCPGFRLWRCRGFRLWRCPGFRLWSGCCRGRRCSCWFGCSSAGGCLSCGRLRCCGRWFLSSDRLHCFLLSSCWCLRLFCTFVRFREFHTTNVSVGKRTQIQIVSVL